jgi:arylsulfatase A-like enzyme
MDSIVEDGVAFTNAYIMGGSSPAVCSPSRAGLFSGRTLWNLENQGRFGYEISDKFTTLPQVFRNNGYTTFATGKNEPGREGHFARSFSAGDKILFKGMSNHYKLPLCPYSPSGDYSKENEVILEGKHSAEVYADACIDYLKDENKSDNPFFAYVSFQTPHDPRQCPDEYMNMYKASDIPLPESFIPEHPFDNGMLRIRDENLEAFPRDPEKVKWHIAAYYSMVTHTDAQIGRILKALEESGKKDNTLIVFASDNGLAVGKHGLMGKQNVYDHALHIPLVLSGPGIPKGELRDQLCYLYDIYPTLCDYAKLETPDTVQYKSLNDTIHNPSTEHRDHLYHAFMDWQRAIRNKQYKLIEYCVKGKRHTQLFDLENDPEEINNLAGDHDYETILTDMRALLKIEKDALNDGNIPYEFTDKQGKDFWEMYEKVDQVHIP